MPETTMNENGLPNGTEDYVRCTWEFTSVKPVAVSEGVNDSSYPDFGFRVAGTDLTHAHTSRSA